MANGKDILELEQFTATSFEGIDSSKPIVIDFTKRRKNQNIIEFFGDEGTGKSSTLAGIMYAMGGAFELDKKKLFNSKDKAIDVNLKFTYNGEQYQVIAGSTRIELKKLQENGKWKPEDSPVATMRKIFGQVGLNPDLKNMKGKDQIEYLLQRFGSGEDASKKMKKLESDIDTVFTARRDVNREIKSLAAALEIDPLYQNREASEKRFSKPISAEKEKKAFDEKSKAAAEFEKNKSAVATLSQEWGVKTDEIVELRSKLDAAIKQEAALKERVEKGNKWVEDNKHIPKEFEIANKEWLNLSQTLADYEKWKGLLHKEKQLIERQEAAVTATGQLETMREQLLKLTKSCLPKVEGLTIKVAAGLDKEDKPEGVFYFDQPLHELNQSKYETMWAKMVVEEDTPFLFFENLNNFGSNTQGLLNSLSKEEGVVIFGTRTDPGVKEMGVAFKATVNNGK